MKKSHNGRNWRGAFFVVLLALAFVEVLTPVYGEDGANSTLATTMLIEQGFERVYNVVGGITTWNESGYPQVSTTEEKKALPGFAAVLALVVVLAVAYRLKERRRS